MRRELGIARCGLACCLCIENEHCKGCQGNDCHEDDDCINKKCSIEKGIAYCFMCQEDCKKGLLAKIKPYGFTLYIKRYGMEQLLDRLEEQERKGIQYHRKGINGDYDDFDDVEDLIRFINHP